MSRYVNLRDVTKSAALVNPIPPTVGGRIKWARKRVGLSLDAVATGAGTSRQHLIRLERDDHVPTDEFLSRLAPVLDHPISFFAEARPDTEARRDVADGFEHLYDALLALARLAVAEAHRERKDADQ